MSKGGLAGLLGSGGAGRAAYLCENNGFKFLSGVHWPVADRCG